MEKEKSTAETTGFYKAPEMFVIKGRQTDHVSTYSEPILELKKFITIKEMPVFQFRMPLDSYLNRIIKRSGDIFVSTIIITCFLSWLIPLIGLLIKLDSKGPVFFLQKRNKKDGKVFLCIKFRSMIENDDADTLPAVINDDRITKLGRFLRKHNLDELPQFFNVLWGDMSITGPRPHMISDNNKYEQLIEFYDYRHKIKPGITGLSQVLGYVGEIRNLQAMQDRAQLDIFYIRRWSLSLDIKILWHTFRKFIGV